MEDLEIINSMLNECMNAVCPPIHSEVVCSLNDKQSEVLECVLNGKNAFITGFAGSGKSFLLEHICNSLKEHSKTFALTAMTGCAAILINGRTLHSTLGIGLAKGSPQDIVKRIRRMEGHIEYLKKLNVLIIDEVSMLSDELFDKIGEIFQILHSSDKPFGKLQIILVGDMSQLKPVEGEYCFYAKSWDQCKIDIHVLTENMRVNSDIRFHNLLQKLRWGIISDMALIEEMKQNDLTGNEIVPTKLFSTNKDVDSINQHSLGLLLKSGKESIQYRVIYSTHPVKCLESTKYTSDNKIPELLTLCVGAQVMVTRNIDFDSQIVNGTRGVIVALNETSVTIKLTSGILYNVTHFHVKPDRKDDPSLRNLDFKYIPLCLAWAMTIHKSQGATIDLLEIDLGESIFACGQAYVALSRARNSKCVKITNFNTRSVRSSKAVKHFYQGFN
jgi:ATP-dependent DNA helicase PIF1